MARPSPPQSPESLGAIMDAMAVGVFAVDLGGVITYFNRAAARISGTPVDEALGRPCREVISSTLCEEFCPLRKAMETRQPQGETEAVLIRGDGRSVLPVRVTAAPLTDSEGRLVGGVETFQGLQLAAILGKKDRKRRQWEDFWGESPQVGRIFDTLKVVAPTPVTVLIEGPTGTGKDLLAHIIHSNSPRANKPFVKVNCAALPEHLLESEMFGYSKGAFTGAGRDKPGRFTLADGGTIFLDEISEMPLSLQAKLLRVLEDREFYPLGASATVKVDVRILAACNKPLAQQVERGLFREDLYWRLNVIRVYIPALKERPQDVPLLIRRFIQQKNVENGSYICRFSQQALDLLLNYDYPGNVRELENILEHACLLCRGDVIGADHLPKHLTPGAPPPATEAAPEHAASPGAAAPDHQEGQRRRILEVVARHRGNKTKAAAELGIDRTTLWRRLKRLGPHRV